MTRSMLVFRAAERVCALELAHVGETMRALPVTPIAGAPTFVGGFSIVRGAAVPVVDARRLLGAVSAGPPAHFITLLLGPRRVMLGVDGVVGVRAFAPDSLLALPSLLSAAAAEVIEAVSTHEGVLLLVLSASIVVPDAIWAALESAT